MSKWGRMVEVRNNWVQHLEVDDLTRRAIYSFTSVTCGAQVLRQRLLVSAMRLAMWQSEWRKVHNRRADVLTADCTIGDVIIRTSYSVLSEYMPGFQPRALHPRAGNSQLMHAA